jgi:hypothetical protein
MSARGPFGTSDLARRSHDALADYEREILAMWDSGRSYLEIMAATGRTRKAVRTVCENYDDRPEIGVGDKLKAANLLYVTRLRQVHGALIGLRT